MNTVSIISGVDRPSSEVDHIDARPPSWAPSMRAPDRSPDCASVAMSRRLDDHRGQRDPLGKRRDDASGDRAHEGGESGYDDQQIELKHRAHLPNQIEAASISATPVAMSAPYHCASPL